MKHEYKFVAKNEEKRAFWLKILRDAMYDKNKTFHQSHKNQFDF